MKNKNIQWSKLIISLIIPQLAGAIGSLATTSNVDGWYTTITKPSFNPPSWIFGPVWTLLFLLMGIALYFIWISESQKARTIALWAFAIQLGLNILWSLLFFGAHNPALAFVEVIILIIAITFNILLFYKVHKLSAYLLAPYLGWVFFASILNYHIWRLNIG